MRTAWWLLATLVATTCGAIFKYEGHHSSISHHNIRPFERRQSVLIANQDKLKTEFPTIIGDETSAITISHIQIHGSSEDLQSAILNGFIETKYTRDELIAVVSESSEFTLFYLEPVEEIPTTSFDPEIDSAVSQCKNGGVLLPNATCVCQPYYSGSMCETSLCMNGGIADINGKCTCPPAFLAEHCQTRSCSIQVEDNMDMSQTTLFYVISLKDSMAQDLNDIITLNGRAVTATKGYFTNYVLTTFLRYKFVNYIQTKVFTSPDDFTNAVMYSVISQGDSAQPIINAMNQAVQSVPTQRPRSYMYVFADTDSSDWFLLNDDVKSSLTQNSLLKTLLYWRIQPILILSNTASKTLYTTTGNSFKVLSWLLRATHGDLILSLKSDVGNVVYDMIPYHVRVVNIFVANKLKCNNQFVLSKESTKVRINLYGENTDVSGVDGTGKAIILSPKILVGTLKIYEVPTDTYQNVTFTNANATAMCGARFWIQSDDVVLNAFANDPSIDNGQIYAIAGLKIVHNAEIVGLKGANGFSWTAVDTMDGVTTYAPTASFQPKPTGCTMGWQSMATFNCTAGAFTSQISIANAGQTFTRVIPNYCFTAGRIIPGALSCQNGGTLSGGICVCNPQYTGNVCQTPICQNSGFANQFAGNGQPSCICPAGYQGTFCDVLTCNSTSTDDIDVSTRAFAIAIHNSYSLAYIGSSLSSMISSMTGGVPAGYYSEFILTTFNAMSKNVTNMVTQRFIDSGDFKNATAIPFQFSNQGDQPVMSAVWGTLSAMSKPRSALFLFVDSPIKKEKNMTVNDVKKYAIERGFRINIVLAPGYQDENNCLIKSDIAIYEDLAYSTEGVFINLCKDSMDASFSFASLYSSKYDYGMQTVELDVVDCGGSGTNMIFTKSLPSQQFTVVVSSSLQPQISVSISNGTGTPLQLTSLSNITGVSVFDASQLNGMVTATITGSGSGTCMVRILEKSPLAVFVAFSNNPQIDMGNVSPQISAPLYPVVRMSTALQSQPKVTVNAYNKNDMLLAYNSVASKRQDSCLFEQFAPDPFACSTPNEEFFVNVVLETPEVKISRTVRAFCRVQDDSCLNGGTYNGTLCLCNVGYTGKNCEQKMCENGATFGNGICNCDSHYTGEFCEYVLCDQWNYVATHDDRSHKFRTVAFGLEMTAANRFSIAVLQQQIDNILAEIKQDDFNVQYALVTYDDTVVHPKIMTSDPLKFAAAIKALPLNSNATLNDVKTAEALDTLHLMTEQPASQNPSLLIFLTSSNTTVGAGASAFTAAMYREGTQINILYTPPPSLLQFDPTVHNFGFLYQVAYQSNGRVLPMKTLSLVNLPTMVGSFIRQNGLVADVAKQDCTKGLFLEFPVESSARELMIEITGLDTQDTITIKDGGKNVITPNSNQQIVTDRGSVMYLFTLNDTTVILPGKWNVSTQSSAGRCQIQARVNSPVHVNIGFTESMYSDFPLSLPQAGYGTNTTGFVTAHVPALLTKNAGVKVQAIDMYSKNYGTGVAVQKSTERFILRSTIGCANQFVTNLFNMDPQNSNYQFISKGVDGRGTDFQRVNIYTHDTRWDTGRDKCLNGAGLRDPRGFCICKSGWTGSRCGTPVCQNKGITVGTTCDCPVPYYGQHCENHL